INPGKCLLLVTCLLYFQRPFTHKPSETDAISHLFAQQNVALNKLTEKVRLLPPSTYNSTILPNELFKNNEMYDFCMCNPPFYSSYDEIFMLQSFKQFLPPSGSSIAGTDSEMICEDGEIGFVLKILRESVVLKDKIRWYSTLVGKKSSVRVLQDAVMEAEGVHKVITKVLRRGNSVRWILCWTFISDCFDTN
ncbi:hypothetical protein HK096_002967, partial [Nowakowskiella sp. JEL0078]